MIKLGYRIISGGTDNHLIVVDMNSKGLSGKEAEVVLENIGISVSRSTIPNDPNPPMNPSGIRIGTAALTTRGMSENEMKQIAKWIDSSIENRENPEYLNQIKSDVEKISKKFPLPTSK